ncbi:MAG: Bifunctional protein FolD protein [Alphaproteobacteria bacterium MarineAlpha2_Bin1]|nr:MAG: Bifunctional protein FolD protein [Alphaproteobacteria bacterium MarineAlpha2_Bin1]
MSTDSILRSKIIDGKKRSLTIREWIKSEILKLKESYNFIPGLAVIIVGDDPASHIYVKNKEKQSIESGMNSWKYILPSDVSEKEIIEQINKLNEDSMVDGILVQLPLPKTSSVSERNVINAISPEKDVDGLTIINSGKLACGEDGLFPATPSGCIILIKELSLNLAGKKALVIGRSNLVGKPIASMLLKENCTVTIAHSKTKNLIQECKNADIIIAAIGIPNFVKGDWVKKDSIIIDVGINRIDNLDNPKKRIVGDVDYEEAIKVCKAITPVPGGVGPMTIACLLLNTLKASCIRRNIESPIYNFTV